MMLIYPICIAVFACITHKLGGIGCVAEILMAPLMLITIPPIRNDENELLPDFPIIFLFTFAITIAWTFLAKSQLRQR